MSIDIHCCDDFTRLSTHFFQRCFCKHCWTLLHTSVVRRRPFWILAKMWRETYLPPFLGDPTSWFVRLFLSSAHSPLGVVSMLQKQFRSLCHCVNWVAIFNFVGVYCNKLYRAVPSKNEGVRGQQRGSEESSTHVAMQQKKHRMCVFVSPVAAIDEPHPMLEARPLALQRAFVRYTLRMIST